jgi:ornithine cyclodeaminase/alanine dehydrogenase-like protein (mu-crystallin family)
VFCSTAVIVCRTVPHPSSPCRGAFASRFPTSTIFDSSGPALQDVGAAIAVYAKALAMGRGTEVKLDD